MKRSDNKDRGEARRLPEDEAPPVSAIEALGRNLYYQFLHGLAGTDPVATGNATHMAKALVEKAKGGDVKAIRVAVDVMETAAGFGSSTVINAHQTVNNDNRGATMFVSDLRIKIVAIMRAVGPVTPAALARHFDTVPDRIAPALAHEWFEERGGVYNLSSKATVESGAASD